MEVRPHHGSGCSGVAHLRAHLDHARLVKGRDRVRGRVRGRIRGVARVSARVSARVRGRVSARVRTRRLGVPTMLRPLDGRPAVRVRVRVRVA